MAAHMDIRSKRTQAVPPRSLFGTNTEIKDGKALREADNLEPPVEPKKPDKLAPFKPKNADKLIKNEIDDYERQWLKARLADGKLKEAKNDAIHFHPNPETISKEIPKGALTYEPKGSYAPLRHDVKPNSRDIELADQYNRLGLDLRNDFNYDRYKTSASNKNYEELGSVLGKGGMFTYKGKEYATIEGKLRPSTNVITGRKITPQKSSKYSKELIPPNIKHMYGNSLCNDFLEDAAEIAKMLPPVSTESSSKSSSKASSAIKSKSSGDNKEQENSEESLYNALGNALRQDIFNGVSYSHVKSLNTSSYTEEVAKRSTESFPPTFAVQRNADTKWNEDMVIHQRLMKRWDVVMAERIASQQQQQ